MTNSVSWSQRWQILRQVASVIWRGGDLARQVIGAASGAAPPAPGASPMSAHSAISSVFSAVLNDKTWIEAAAMAARADQFLQSGDLLVRVVRDHGKVAQDDVRIGVATAKLLAPRLAAELVTFLDGPLGGISVNIFAFWLNGLLTGTPVQPKDPAYYLPEGSGGVSTGA